MVVFLNINIIKNRHYLYKILIIYNFNYILIVNI